MVSVVSLTLELVEPLQSRGEWVATHQELLGPLQRRGEWGLPEQE
jgi:hypothetical protein